METTIKKPAAEREDRSAASGNTHNLIWHLRIGGAMFFSAAIGLVQYFKRR